uniref:Uncharacterized protein n=1 Tax=Chelonoidis abingdonii TaxID=106734 RepID=A0A8C0GXQ4_CHEAB
NKIILLYLPLLCKLSPSQRWRHRLGQSKSPSQSRRVWLIPSHKVCTVNLKKSY